MATITFVNAASVNVFSSECEGIAEVRADDNDREQEMLLVSLIGLIGRETAEDTTYPVTFTLPCALVDTASLVLENCLDESTGVDENDDDAGDYIFPGYVYIATPKG